MVIEIGFVIRGGGRHRIGPAQAIIVGTGDSDLLTPKLWERIRQAAIVDGDSTGEAERAISTEPWAVVKAGIAARDPPNGVESRQEATAPRLAIIRRTIIG